MNSLSLRCFSLSLVACLLAGESLSAWADGFVLAKSGHYVPEEEQQAFIEWADGHERLFIRTRTAKSSEPTLWIVPVPASPELVSAEPVAKLPVVRLEHNVVTAARGYLKKASMVAFVMDTGLVPLCCLTFGGCGMSSDAKPGSVDVHQHVEKLGMVLEVLTAKSGEALDGYLTSKQLHFSAASITAIAPYLNQDYTLICAWAAKESEVPTARAIRIDFPSAMVFYPLRPTSIYQSSIATSICVRGFVHPHAGNEVSGQKCHYVTGPVGEMDPDSKGEEAGYYPVFGRSEPLTRVELPASPSLWNQDLVLEPGTPAPIRFCQFVEEVGEGLPWGLALGLGVLLAPLLPRFVVPRDQRSWRDLIWAMLVGACMALTIYAAAIVFCLWHAWRGRGVLQVRAGKTNPEPMSWVYCFLGTYGAYGLTALVLYGTYLPPSRDYLLGISVGLLVLLLVALPASVVVDRVYLAAGARGAWLLAFAALHLGATLSICSSLRWWLASWE